MAAVATKKATKPHYFTAETGNAIVMWQSLPAGPERDRLYTTKISPAFVHLAEGLIRTGHWRVRVGFDELRDDVVGALFTKMTLYDPARCHNVFSFFNTIALNYLRGRYHLLKSTLVAGQCRLDMNPEVVALDIKRSTQDDAPYVDAEEFVDLLREVRKEFEGRTNATSLDAMAILDALPTILRAAHEGDTSTGLVGAGNGLVRTVRKVSELTGIVGQRRSTALHYIKVAWRRVKLTRQASETARIPDDVDPLSRGACPTSETQTLRPACLPR